MMTEATLGISFGNQSSFEDTYWLRLELVEEKTTMTVGEAAEIIDALYQTDPCDSNNTTTPETVVEPTAPDWQAILALLNLPVCDDYNSQVAGDPGAYDVYVNVYRSHQDEVYKLIMSNGYASGPIRTTERVVLTLEVEGQSYVTLDTPIIARPVITWVDVDGPPIEVTNNTLHWEGNVTGVIRAEFDTVYDIVHIHVTGIANTTHSIVTGTTDEWLGSGWYSGTETAEELTEIQDIECNVLAFYHYQYEELTLNKPEQDESVEDATYTAICRNDGSTIINPDDPDPDPTGACHDDCDASHDPNSTTWDDCHEACDEERCYQRRRFTKICVCGGDESSETETVPAPCNGASTGSTVDEVSGGATYEMCGDCEEVNDRGYYESQCCYPPGFPLPCCEEAYGPWSGGIGSDRRDQLNYHYPNATIVMVGPESGRCGDTITKQDIDSQDCCDGVEALARFDGGNCNEPIGLNSSTQVCVSGGDGDHPVTWTVSTGGYWFEEPISGQGNTLQSGDSVCGPPSIQADDGCSNTTFSIEQTEAAQEPVQLNNYDMVASSNAWLYVTASYGVLPMIWSGGQDLTLDSSSGRSAIFKVGPDFCGTSDVRVTDACGNEDSGTVRSTTGFWNPISSSEYDPCELPEGLECGSAPGGPEDRCEDQPTPVPDCQNGAWKVYARVGTYGFKLECPSSYEGLICPMGTVLVPISGYEKAAEWECMTYNCNEWTPGVIYTTMETNGCCKMNTNANNPDDPPHYQYYAGYQHITTLFEWYCA